MDVTEIYIANLADAFDKVNQYVALGITAAITALALDLRPRGSNDASDAETIFGLMRREPAKLVFLGICFTAGAMASYAADQVVVIVSKLGGDSSESVLAACTRASIATSPPLVRLLAAGLPAVLAAYVVLRAAWGLRKNEAARGLLFFAFVLVTPYLVLGRRVFSVCLK